MNGYKRLSPAEKVVFDLILEGYGTREIAEKLFLSINTIRNHRTKIRNKMGVKTMMQAVIYYYRDLCGYKGKED